MNLEKLKNSDLKNKYFARKEKWDWLNVEMIHVFDSTKPRFITMDPWPQKIFLDALGDKTVEQYIYFISEQYSKNNIPYELPNTILETIERLIFNEKLIIISDEIITLDDTILKPTSELFPIDLIGTWNGVYNYNLPETLKDERMKNVEFTIQIESTNKNKFKGIVQDNNETGGTPGVGTIQGEFTPKGVTFKKDMPISSNIGKNKERIIEQSKKHPSIIYSGVFSPDKHRISGTWEFEKKKSWWSRKKTSNYVINGEFYMNKKKS